MSKKIFFIILVIILGLYYYWPKISNLNILSPKEQELHGYLKEIIPTVRSALQKFKQLDNDPANATFAAELGKLSDEILTINERYWKTGSKSETFVRILINKVRGSKEKEELKIFYAEPRCSCYIPDNLKFSNVILLSPPLVKEDLERV